MSFTVQVYFTGLGVGLIRADRVDKHAVTGVDLLLVDTSGKSDAAGSNAGSMPSGNMEADKKASGKTNKMKMTADASTNQPAMVPHLPRLSFEMEDLAATSAAQLNLPAVTTTTGMPLVSFDLSGQDLELVVTDEASGNGSVGPAVNGNGNGNGKHFVVRGAAPDATFPGPAAPDDALSWIPDLEADLGITDLIEPGPSLAGSPYTARIKLPAGAVSSQRLFLRPSGTLAQFVYGNAPLTRVLADQFVWTRSGVQSVAISGLADTFQLDAALRQMRGEPQIVRIAVTCLPATLPQPDRFRSPQHFPMFTLVSSGGTAPRPVTSVGGVPVCAGIACPPPLAWR
jgi:hypothetical protein